MTLTTPAKKDCLRESGAFAWVVVIALGLMSAGTTGTYSIIAGSFVAPVCEDLGFDYTSFSFYFTAILLGLALGLPLLSRFIPKVIGKPWHICIELVLIAAGAAMAFYTEVWMFTVSAAVIGICFSFTTGVCMSDVIDQWFSKSSGLAIGLAWGVNSLCTLLLSPVITLVIEQQGWRTGYIVLAAVSAAMILPASAFIIRLNPSDRNMLPYGETASETHESCSADEQEDVLSGMALRDAAKTPSFILCVLLLCVAQLTCCMNQLFPTYASEVGFNPIVGSLMVSAASLSDIFLNPFVGKTCDKLGAIKATVAWTGVSILSFLLLIIGGSNEDRFHHCSWCKRCHVRHRWNRNADASPLALWITRFWKDLFDRLLSGLCRRCFWNAGHDEGLRHGRVIPGSIYLLHCLQPYDCCVCYRFRLSQ